MLTEFATVILYGQLVLANPASGRAPLVWTNDEVAQGFAWSPDEVAFGVPDHNGECRVSVTVGTDAAVRVADDALWALAVPFTAQGPAVEVGTVMLERSIPIMPGRIRLSFRPGRAGRATPTGWR